MELVSHRPGGLNRYLGALANALARSGIATSTLVVGPVPKGLPGVLAGGRTSDPVPFRIARYWWATQRLAGWADVMDAHFALYAALPLYLGRLAGRPWTVHFQGPWADESDFERRIGTADRLIRRALERMVYRRAQELVTLSAAFRRVLVESYDVLPWRVHLIPPGVDLEAFSPEGRDQARAALGLAHDDQVVLAVRRLTRRMGLSVLLDAWTEVASADRNRLLVIAGDGPLKVELEREAERLGVASQLRLLGRLDEGTLTKWFRAADVSVVPSLALEGFGLTVLESLASGTPVLVSDAGGLPEAVQGLDPSLVVPAGDAAALASRLGEALGGRLPARAACRQYAESFSWERVSRSNLAVYRRALEPKPSRGIRVVFLGHTARLSGGELALLRLLPALEGVEAHVILAEDGPLVARLLRSGVSVEVLAMRERARGLRRDQVRLGALPITSVGETVAYIARLALRLRRLEPDLVHTNSLKAAMYGAVAASMAGVPCIWHIRDRIAPDYLTVGAVRAVRAMARRLPVAIIANSASTLATVAPYRGHGVVVWSATVETVAPARERDHVVADPSSHIGSAHLMQSTMAPLRVGIIGRIAAWKGQDRFLSAFARAFPDGNEEAIVIGDALFEADQGYAASLSGLARKLGVADRVEFRGFREDIAAELARLDILVHASVTPEPFGQVVVEGMAAGVPVVAADAGGPAEIITDGVDGALYPIGDIDALAGTMRSLATNPSLRDRLGRGGQARAMEFTPARIGAQVVAIYRTVLGLRPNEGLAGR